SAQQAYGIFWRDGTTTPYLNGEDAWSIDLFLDNKTTPTSTAPLLVSVPFRATGMTLDGNIGSGSANNLIQGNTIGLGFNGSTVVANASRGVFISGYGNTVGGSTAATRNVISSNTSNGILI